MGSQYFVKKIYIPFLICLVLFFSVIEIKFIKFPGPLCDEAGVATEALDIKQSLSGKSFMEALLKRTIPLMRIYHGALDVYVLLFMFSIFPVSVESMRIVAIFFGVLTMFFTYLFAKEFLDKKYALLSVFLLAINPGFIMGTKVGIHHATIMNALSMAILLCLIKWFRLKRNIYFYIAMFLLGLGIWTRLQFFWFVFGLFLTSIIFKNNIRQRFEFYKANKFWKFVFLGAVFFLLGSSMIVYHECTSNFSTSRLLFQYLKRPIYGVNNLQYFRGLSIIMQRFCNYLTGSSFFVLQFQDSSNNFINRLYPWIFFSSLVYLLISVILRKNLPYRKNIEFLLFLLVGMLMVTPFSVSGYADFHLFIFYPFIQLIISVATINFIHSFKKLNLVAVIFAIFSIIFIVKEINGVRRYLYLLNKTGGRLYYSPAIYDLADYLLKKKESNIIVGSWGIGDYLRLSGLRIQEACWPIKDSKTLEPFFQDKTNLYVFYPEEFPNTVNNKNLNTVESFILAAKQLNLRLVEIKRFYEKDGSPVYIIMRQEKSAND